MGIRFVVTVMLVSWCGLLVLPAHGFGPGDPAPGFVAADSNGVEHRLAAYRGQVVVLEWTNHDCPYVRKHYDSGNMQRLQRRALAEDVVWLSVVSSRPGAQGHVTGGEANELTRARGASPAAVLLDPSGEIGRLYGARTTPHMFVIDDVGRIAYMGGIDNRRSANPKSLEGATNYVDLALDALAAGTPVATAAAAPYGCSIKY